MPTIGGKNSKKTSQDFRSCRADVIDAFYSRESINEWRAILGDGFHYHFGFFEGDEDLKTGQEKTVRDFYSYIAPGSTVLDIGCGWGGPARMLRNELACEILCVTISKTQAAFCRASGLSVEIMDVERQLPKKEFDVAFSLESMEHIFDKSALLRRLRKHASRLVLSTGCIADVEKQPRRSFGGSIRFCTPEDLKGFLESSGWSIISTRNRRFQSLRTLALWKRNFDCEFGKKEATGQLNVLRNLVEESLRSPLRWGLAHPLVDIIAI